MNEKEIAEIRRRFRPDKSNITRIRGCYVNDQREIVSEFSQPLGLMPQEESEELLAILKKTLSGTVGKNLIDIEFATRQVLEGEEHKLLMALRESALKDDAAVREFYGRIIETLGMEGNYLILLASDQYDIPFYAKDGEAQENSSEVYSYFLCSICPVKPRKPALGYYVSENTFRNITADWVVSPRSWASCSRLSMTAAPTSTAPSIIPVILRKTTRSSLIPCLKAKSRCRPPSRKKPFSRSWARPSRKNAVWKSFRRFTSNYPK